VSTKDRIGWFLIALAVFSLAKGGGGLPSIVPGPRSAAIYYESADKTTEFNRLTIALRDGEQAEKLKPTPLDILDVTQHPQPDPTTPLPSLYVRAGETVLYKGACPTTAPAVVEVIKSHGG
jgi:hypothetical protein